MKTIFALHFLGLFISAVVLVKNVESVPAIIPEGRIVSGYEAVPGQLPWQVIIKEDEINNLMCGGSIISDSWVATAAHCCYGHDSLLLRFGTIDLYDDDAVNMTATELHIHPQFNPSTYNNDVCLIKLPQPLEFSKYINAISLVPTALASNNFIGSVAVIAGFGVKDDEYMDPSEKLLWAQVQIIDNAECDDVYNPGLVIDSTMCGKGYEMANMSICSGDSGGPLVMMDDYGNWIQIGINSFVPEDQCTEALPSAYARMTSFLSYIYNTTGLTQI